VRVILKSTFPRTNIIFAVWTEVMNAHKSVHAIWQARTEATSETKESEIIIKAYKKIGNN